MLPKFHPNSSPWDDSPKTDTEISSELERRTGVLATAFGTDGHPCDPFSGDKIPFKKELSPRTEADHDRLLRYRSQEFNRLQEAYEAVQQLE